VATTSPEEVPTEDELSVDALAARSGLPTRTIREYQSMGLLPPPERRGRVGIYRPAHLRRLELIGRLQARGYSLAGIRDLLTSWHEGHDLTDVLGLSPDELVHIDEPGAPATLDQLSRLLPQLVPEHLDQLTVVGVVDRCGPDRYCVPSPSLLQLSVDLLAAGYTPANVIDTLDAVHTASDIVADAAAVLLARPPAGLDGDQIAQLATRGRGLLAHGVGRMAIYELGRRLDQASPARRNRDRR
jgi:DNA-binding transcriptional MerR regulator